MNSVINFWGGQLNRWSNVWNSSVSVDRLTNMEHTKRKIKINLLYYLENILPIAWKKI